MWMGSKNGILRVFHAPTLKCRYAGTLSLSPNDEQPSDILDILHVQERSDRLCRDVGRGGVAVPRQAPQASGPEGGGQDSPWRELSHVSHGQSRRSGILRGVGNHGQQLRPVLEWSHAGWRKMEFVSDPKDTKLRLCSYVAHCSFVGRDGKHQNHVWLSYRHRSVLVCWDAQSRRQRCLLNCMEKLSPGQYY